MLHIARSGILASRAALSVAAENVANVGTEGYRRRDVSSVTASGGQTTPQTLPTGGQGVSVIEVRRAFDQLVAERARMATGAQAASAAHKAVAEALETRLIPGENGLDGRMRGFFDSLARLAASPADVTMRAVTLQSAGALATDIAETAGDLARLRRDTVAQAGLVATQAQGLLEDLHRLNSQISQLGERQTAGHHPLADRRDALLNTLAQKLPVSVNLLADGRAEVRLGSDAGPVLLDRSGAARLSVTAPDRLTLHITLPQGETRETRMLGAGQLGGLALGVGALDMAQAEFDQLARRLAEGLNQVHRSGVDLFGQPGRDLFRLDGWTATPAAANGGRLHVNAVVDGPQLLQGPLDLVYDGATLQWHASDADGSVLASGRERLILPGVTVDLIGTARDGDRITLSPIAGRATDFRLVVSNSAALAPAGDITVAAAPNNAGVARLQVSRPTDTPRPEAIDLVVSDAANGRVELRSALDDAVLDVGTLGPDGRVTLSGLDLLLSGVAQSGDRFTLRPTGMSSGNGEVAQTMAALRTDGQGSGFLDMLSRFQGDIGIRAAAAQRADDTAQARLESAEREEAALGAVNLDHEAARMVELQQAYQASAQALTIARSLFDTLLRMM